MTENNQNNSQAKASTPNFNELEQKILKFWDENKIFEKSLEQTRDKEPYIFYGGYTPYWYRKFLVEAGFEIADDFPVPAVEMASEELAVRYGVAPDVINTEVGMGSIYPRSRIAHNT